jgi:alkylation response protein AidB-like acyl-CoA dehydrogenase
LVDVVAPDATGTAAGSGAGTAGSPTGPASDRVADFAAAVADTVGRLGAGAGTRAIWSALGRTGLLQRLYPADTATHRPDPRLLRELVRAVDAVHPPGVVLGVCVPAASALPLLREASRRGPADPGAALAGDVGRAALDGAGIVALAATDAGAAGSDLVRMTTTVDSAGGQLVVHGGKRWITNATVADHALVLARRRPGEHFTNFSWVLVPLATPGVRVEPVGGPFFAGAGLGHLHFDTVRLGQHHLVGGAGRGLATFARHVATERLSGALWAAALTRRVLVRTRERLTTPPAGGRPLWEHETVRARFGRCLVAHVQLESVCDRLIAEFDGPGAALAAMLAKVAASDLAQRVLGECATLHGADGFDTDGVQLWRAEAAMLGIAGGSADLVVTAVADHAGEILDQPRIAAP